MESKSGATILVGGFGEAGVPNLLLRELARRRLSGLTIVSNNAGSSEAGLGGLLASGCVSRIVCSSAIARLDGVRGSLPGGPRCPRARSAGHAGGAPAGRGSGIGAVLHADGCRDLTCGGQGDALDRWSGARARIRAAGRRRPRGGGQRRPMGKPDLPAGDAEFGPGYGRRGRPHDRRSPPCGSARRHRSPPGRDARHFRRPGCRGAVERPAHDGTTSLGARPRTSRTAATSISASAFRPWCRNLCRSAARSSTRARTAFSEWGRPLRPEQRIPTSSTLARIRSRSCPAPRYSTARSPSGSCEAGISTSR